MERKRVKPISEMDNETLLKHMNARHMPVSGMAAVGPTNDPLDPDENLLRAFHERVHAMPNVFDHYHRSETDE